MEASPLFYSIKAMNKSADGRRCKLLMYLPNHQRMVVTWCRWICGPRCRVYQREQPASSSVHSRSARNHKDSTRLSLNKTFIYQQCISNKCTMTLPRSSHKPLWTWMEWQTFSPQPGFPLEWARCPWGKPLCLQSSSLQWNRERKRTAVRRLFVVFQAESENIIT